jgi:hypothetical protein
MTAPRIPSLQEILQTDLDYICANLKEEFGRMAGGRLLITGGAGFLGYYLVHAALHFNKGAAKGQPIDVTVWDNFIRGTPQWLTSLQGTPNFTMQRHDLIEPLPQPMPDFDWIIHAAGIASPPYYRKYPLKTIDANINGLRNLLVERDLRRPDARMDPDSGGISRPRLMYRPTRLLRRVQALRRDDMRDLRAAVWRTHKDGSPVQQLRPRPQDHG